MPCDTKIIAAITSGAPIVKPKMIGHLNDSRGLEDMLRGSGVPQYEISLVRSLLQYAGESRRSGDVLNNKSFFSSLKTSFKKVWYTWSCI